MPGEDQKVFEDTDINELKDLPTGPWVNEINQAIAELVGDVATAEKN